MSIVKLECPCCGLHFVWNSEEWDDTSVQDVIDNYHGETVHVHKCKECGSYVEVSIKLKKVFECYAEISFEDKGG